MSTPQPRSIPDIHELERLVQGIHDVTGCRIKTDPAGEIVEIHVTAASDRPGRNIARDVDTLLNVKAGLDVDHRKIGVAVTGPPLAEEEEESGPRAKEAAAAPAETGLIVEDGDVNRPIIRRVGISHEDNQVQAVVTLSLDGRKAVGETRDADTPSGHIAALVRATLEAVLILYDTRMRFSDPQFRIVSLGSEDVFLVHLSAVEGRSMHSFSGSAIIRQDSRQSAVMATLGALNRIMGLWPQRSAVEYDII